MHNRFVSLEPTLVSPQAVAGAFYAIADLRPARITICTDTGGRDGEEFSDHILAFKRLEALVQER